MCVCLLVRQPWLEGIEAWRSVPVDLKGNTRAVVFRQRAIAGGFFLPNVPCKTLWVAAVTRQR